MLGAFALVYGAVALAAMYQIAADTQARDALRRSYERIVELQSTFSTVQDAEIGQRGYVITGSEVFLQPYREALSVLDARDRLAGQLSDPGDLDVRLTRLDDLIDRKRQHMEQTIAAYDALGPEPATVLVRMQHGKRLMDGIRTIFGEVIAEERILLESRLRETHRQASGGPFLIFAALAFAALISLLAIASVRRHLDRSEAESRRAREAETLLRATMENITQGITVFDSDMRLIAWNDRFFEMFDLPPRYAAVGTPIADIVAFNAERGEFGSGDKLEQVRRRMERLGRWRDFHFERERPDGRVVEVHSRIADRSLLVTTYTDITERKRAERLKEEFVSTVSHELRTPLTSIAGSLGLLAGGVAGALPPRAARLVEIAHSNSERLVRLVNDILDIEKLSAGKVHFVLEVQALKPLVETAIQANQSFADRFGVTIRLATDDSDPRASVDADRFAQVVTNLLSNAAKFSPPDGTVDVYLGRHGHAAVLTVRDRGPGIPEAFRSRIFERFAQADSSDTRQKGGTGLGLSIVRHIVENLRGSIRFDCPPEGGTVFRVELPIAATPAQAERTATSVEPRRAVLLSEGDAQTAAVLRSALDLSGLQVETVRTADEAEARVAEPGCAALVVDLGAGSAEAIETVRKLRARAATASVPVLAVAVRRHEDGRILGVEAVQVADWLDKPPDLDRLMHAVRLSASAGAGRVSILHVEDDADLREVVENALSPLADMLPAGTLAEARAALARERIDLVLLDIGLPDGSGLDLLPELRAASGGGPSVVLFSAAEFDPDLVPAVAGALTKSRATVDDLVSTVRAIVRRPDPGQD
ncbi:MAG: PAS-domain containing protein [Alphaproteobacteria bacterium]